ncbi:DUF3572 domain-containing protein [Sphingomonas jejuensis]
MNRRTAIDPRQAALMALGWTLSDDERASRLLALTGLDPADLRSRLEDDAVLAAILRFLETHEPDLIACADAIDVPPADLVASREALER